MQHISLHYRQLTFSLRRLIPRLESDGFELCALDDGIRLLHALLLILAMIIRTLVSVREAMLRTEDAAVVAFALEEIQPELLLTDVAAPTHFAR